MLRLLRELLIGVLICGLVLTGLVGCTEDENGGETGQPPELPPDASMTIDLSAFEGATVAPGLQFPGKNFNSAAIRVGFLNLAVVVGLALPAGVFKEAVSTEPTEQDDGSWLWSYTVNILGVDIEANLTGSLEGLETAWSMRVTSNFLLLDDFEWYTGESALDNASGSWLFYDHKVPNEAKELAGIEWAVSGADKAELVISNLETEGPNSGDVLTYSVEGTTALVSFYDASEDILADIEWDLVTIAGSLRVPNYNNGERAYWDEDKQDVVP